MTDLSLSEKKYTVSIEYCVPCDYSSTAFRVTAELLSHYQHVIDNLVLITGTKGVFEVNVNDKSIFSKRVLKRQPRPGEVLQSFQELVGPNISPYPR